MGDELDRTRRRSVLDSVPGTPSTPVNNHPSQVISGASTTEGKLAANLNGGHKDSEKSRDLEANIRSSGAICPSK